MTDTNELRNWTEAPASVTVQVRLAGYDTALTLRGDSGAEVLPKLQAALGWLEEHGAEPTTSHTPTGNGNGGGGNGGGANGDPKICPIHHVAMQRREKNGDVWYSHKAVNPETGAEYWCRGKAE